MGYYFRTDLISAHRKYIMASEVNLVSMDLFQFASLLATIIGGFIGVTYAITRKITKVETENTNLKENLIKIESNLKENLTKIENNVQKIYDHAYQDSQTYRPEFKFRG
jgi:hypothetical protein